MTPTVSAWKRQDSTKSRDSMSLAPDAYCPGANSVRLDVTATTGSISLPGGPGNTIEVINVGNATTLLDYVFIVVGTGAQTAAIPASGAAGAGIAVAPGEVKRFKVPQGSDTLAAITAATKTATIFVSRGLGI